MLGKEEIKEIRQELEHYENHRAASIDALKIVQKHHGWVSDEHLKEVAEIIGMSAADLDGVATFYNLIFRQPVGEHVILMCDSISCWINKYDNIKAHCCKRLGINMGETTPDKKFTLLTIPCLGTCDRGPAMMVDNDLHQDLDEAKVDTILERYKS